MMQVLRLCHSWQETVLTHAFDLLRAAPWLYKLSIYTLIIFVLATRQCDVERMYFVFCVYGQHVYGAINGEKLAADVANGGGKNEANWD